ncbi:hypothetical protein [Nocardia brasiliensis]
MSKAVEDERERDELDWVRCRGQYDDLPAWSRPDENSGGAHQ